MEPLGLNMIKMGLQDVLYDPKSGSTYNLNTNTTTIIGKGGAGEGQESNSGENPEMKPSSSTDM